MRPQRLGKALLFPHGVVLAVLSLASGAFLALSMTRMAEDSPLAIASYVLSAYTLTVLLARTPRLYRAFRAFKAENKYARRWQSDPRLRMGYPSVFRSYGIPSTVFLSSASAYTTGASGFCLLVYIRSPLPFCAFSSQATQEGTQWEKIRKESSSYTAPPA